jgi:uncharacterized protein YehS (DUF1456 family)
LTNNDILRNLRYTFDFSDSKMIEIFGLAELEVTRSEISQWLKKEDDSDYKSFHDIKFSSFLDGLINYKRGKKEGPQPKPEKRLNNNIIFRKLKIAFELKSEDILEIMELAELRLSNQELSAFFRRSDHKNFRECKDQVLRNFLKGLQFKVRPPK